MNQATLDRPAPQAETAARDTAPLPMTVHAFGQTDPGRVRPGNEDHFLVAEMVDRGMITAEDTRQHQLRHVVTHVRGGGQAGVRVNVQRVALERATRCCCAPTG